MNLEPILRLVMCLSTYICMMNIQHFDYSNIKLIQGFELIMARYATSCVGQPAIQSENAVTREGTVVNLCNRNTPSRRASRDVHTQKGNVDQNRITKRINSGNNVLVTTLRIVLSFIFRSPDFICPSH